MTPVTFRAMLSGMSKPTAPQPIDLTERRGTLTYLAPDGIEVRTTRGWFMRSLDGRTVVARKIGGRNRWQFCGIESVIEFREEVK